MMGWAIRAVEGVSGGLLLGPATRLKTKWTAQLLLYRQLLAHEAGGGALRESRMAVVVGGGKQTQFILFQQTRNGTGTVEVQYRKQTWNTEASSLQLTVYARL